MGEDHIHLDDRKQGIKLPQLPLPFPPPCGKFGFVLKREKALTAVCQAYFSLICVNPNKSADKVINCVSVQDLAPVQEIKGISVAGGLLCFANGPFLKAPLPPPPFSSLLKSCYQNVYFNCGWSQFFIWKRKLYEYSWKWKSLCFPL